VDPTKHLLAVAYGGPLQGECCIVFIHVACDSLFYVSSPRTSLVKCVSLFKLTIDVSSVIVTLSWFAVAFIVQGPSLALQATACGSRDIGLAG